MADKEASSVHPEKCVEFHGFEFRIWVELPQYVELAIASTQPGVRGDTAAGGATKVAKLETGLEVKVPLFIKLGEIVRVSIHRPLK